MKPNPGNYESWIDPDNGQWIKMKNGPFKDVIWRPADMKLDENDNQKFSFTCEFFGDLPERMGTFEKSASAVVQAIVQDMVNADNK